VRGRTNREEDVATPEATLSHLLKRRAPAAQSLIVTLFGDCVSQHGGSLWLGSLIELLHSFSINERLTRTSVYRLVQDDWLAVQRIGRRSYYRFTAHGQREYERTAARVYSSARPEWDGTWTLAILHDVAGAARETLRTSLGWIGFGQLAPGVFARPSPDRQGLTDLIEELDLERQVLVMEARVDPASITELAEGRWHLPELAKRYRRFLADFEPMGRCVSARIDPQTSFVARSLLIHEFRRIVLTDPDLPGSLLPENWPGHAAAALTKALYAKVGERSTRYVQTLENEAGALPEPDAAFFHRFGRSARR
jgi:phenylacetic acid degradation operon negative regulatory protein